MIDVSPILETPEVVLPVAFQVETRISLEADVEKLDARDARDAVGVRSVAGGSHQVPAARLEDQAVGADRPDDLLGFGPAEVGDAGGPLVPHGGGEGREMRGAVGVA